MLVLATLRQKTPGCMKATERSVFTAFFADALLHTFSLYRLPAVSLVSFSVMCVKRAGTMPPSGTTSFP